MSSTGDDANRGLKTEPKRTINAAISFFSEKGWAGEVRVAGGTYEVSYAEGTHVILAEGVILTGGYPPDFGGPGSDPEPDPDLYETIIRDTSTSSHDTEHNRAVDGGTDVTVQTVMRYFTIIGGGGREADAVVIKNSSPKIIHCTIRGGFPDHETHPDSGAHGIYCVGGGPYIGGCDISGSQNPDARWSTGVSVDEALHTFDLNVCNIDAGKAAVSCKAVSITGESDGLVYENEITVAESELAVGIYLHESNPQILDNLIEVANSGEGSGIGISMRDSNPIIRKNRITVTGDTPENFGIAVVETSDPHIGENTILVDNAAVSIGVALWSNQGTQILIERNRIFGGNSDDTSTGISISESSVRVLNNLIHGGTGRITTGVLLSDATVSIWNNVINGGGGTELVNAVGIHNTALEIINNILFTSGTVQQIAIQEHEGEGDTPEVFLNNLFFDYEGSMTYYQDYGDGGLSTVVDVENDLTTEGKTVGGNLDGDPMFADLDGPDDDIDTMDDNDWRLSSGTASSIYEGGNDFLEEYSYDFLGNQRTVPWSIGAFEYEGS